jgi:hypothetical protein
MNKYTTKYTNREILDLATDEAGNLMALAKRTGISRRRLGKIKAGSPLHRLELNVLVEIIERRL